MLTLDGVSIEHAEALTYSLGDLTIKVECEQPHQAERIRALWQRVFVLQPGNSPANSPSIFFRFTSSLDSLDRPALDEQVFSSPELCVFTTNKGFLLHSGSSILNLDLADSCATGVLSEEFWNSPLLAQREFFLLSLLMLIRPHGLYGLHANGVVKEDIGFLIVGESGCGKTTLAISLIREGWNYLSDDALLLQNTANRIKILAFRRGFSCPEDLVTHFPELIASKVHSPSLNAEKRLIDIESVYPGRFLLQCCPQVILFPKITTTQHSLLIPMNETNTLISLMTQSAGIMTDRTLASKQLDVLKLLVHQSKSFQLLLGADIYQQPASVSHLLRQTIQS